MCRDMYIKNILVLCPTYSISQEMCTRFCFAVLCCGYTLTDFPKSIRLTSLALWQSNDCPSASKATLMNMDKYFIWIHYERLRNHNKAKHNKTGCIFLGIYCTSHLVGTNNVTQQANNCLRYHRSRYVNINVLYRTWSREYPQSVIRKYLF